GGKGFNQAIAAARAGARTAFVCALGDDAGGHLARALADADGLDLRALASEAPTGTAGIYVDAAGRNSIVIGAGANAGLSPAHVAAQADAFRAARVVLAQLESPVDTIAATLAEGRERGATTMLNPAPANAATTLALLALADVLTPNETEFSALVARHVGGRIDPSDIAELDQGRLHALCRELAPAASVVVTLGAIGCFVSHPEGAMRGDASPCYRIGAESVRATDTTGAGDAFNGALAASLAIDAGLAFADQVAFASRYAALSTERAGAAASMPLRADVLARFG
ncbi:MAG TPA: PfkB family carbohydrate kinase, partial [Luteimonas sp.]|nr:PfkB family carbohydrate kinase [Luteimonas sp.]